MTPSKVIELDIDQVMKQGLRWNLGLLLLFAVFFHFFSEPLSFRFSISGILLFIAGYFLLIATHELLHLLGFLLFGRVPLSSLKFGVNLSLGVAYATTDRPMKNRAMQKALLLPLWLTGVLPALVGFLISSQILVLLSTMLIAGAAGDIVMYRELRKTADGAWVRDDPAKPRLYIYD